MTTNNKRLKELLDNDAAERKSHEEKVISVKRDIDLTVSRDSSGAYDVDLIIPLIESSVTSGGWIEALADIGVSAEEFVTTTREEIDDALKKEKENKLSRSEVLDKIYETAVYVKLVELGIEEVNWVNTIIKPIATVVADSFPGLDTEFTGTNGQPVSVITLSNPCLPYDEKYAPSNITTFSFHQKEVKGRLRLYGATNTLEIIPLDEKKSITEIIEFLAPSAMKSHMESMNKNGSDWPGM